MTGQKAIEGYQGKVLDAFMCHGMEEVAFAYGGGLYTRERPPDFLVNFGCCRGTGRVGVLVLV
jgi:hypothetical protein